jgi:ParB-like chromosome segregation protein Spo0J
MKSVELILPRLVDVADLIPYDKNARTHSDEQVAQIAASITEFGWTNPIIVGASNLILAGHGRRLAALHLRIKRVPVLDVTHLTPEQQRLYVIADNKLTLNGGWDLPDPEPEKAEDDRPTCPHCGQKYNEQT